MMLLFGIVEMVSKICVAINLVLEATFNLALSLTATAIGAQIFLGIIFVHLNFEFVEGNYK
jgi:hypothetical protein